METSDQVVTWAKVTARADRIAIVGSGPSAGEIDASVFNDLDTVGVHIIAINRALNWLPVAHSWFTLDPDDRIRPLMERRRPGVDYYAAVPDDYGRPDAKIAYHRHTPAKGICWLHRIAGDGVLSAKDRLSERRGAIHTGNSVWGGLGLAYLMRPQKVAFVGLDATNEPYAHGGGAPRTRFDHLPQLFASALPQLARRGVKIRNGSRHSRVTCFRRCEPLWALDWLCS